METYFGFRMIVSGKALKYRLWTYTLEKIEVVLAFYSDFQGYTFNLSP